MDKEYFGTHAAYTITVHLRNPDDADILFYLYSGKDRKETTKALRELIRLGYEARKNEASTEK